MGYFTFGETSQLRSYADAPSPNARIFVYLAGGESLSPIFKDSNLTFAQANPVVADANGYVAGFFLADGAYRIRILSRTGKTLLDEDNVEIRSRWMSDAERSFDRVSDLLADTSLSYTSGLGRQKVTENQIVHAFQDDFFYQVLPSGETGPHLVTAGGVKLGVLRGSAPLSPAQFGADLTGQTNAQPAMQAMLDYLSEHGGYARISGTLRIEFPAIPADPTGEAALFLEVLKSESLPTVLNFSGATINYAGTPDTYLLRAYQSGSKAAWLGLEVRGGFFDGSEATDPAGCILWDDLGHSRLHGCHFHDWTRTSPAENTYAIHQRNYDTWSENNVHENHTFTKCDTWFYTSLHPTAGGTSSMSRTRVENLFGGSCKAYAVINTAPGLYDSVIRNIKGNGQKIAAILNTGGAVGGTHLEEVKTEQGEPEVTNTTGQMTAGQTTLTVTSGTPFKDWMVQGMPVTIAGAGGGGADLVTWITGYVSGSEVAVNHAAGTTVTDTTVTVSSTVCYEDRSAAHQFIYSKLNNRDGDLLVNLARYTGSNPEPRGYNMGALDAVGEVRGLSFTASQTSYAEKVVSTDGEGYLYPVYRADLTLPDNTATQILGTTDTQISGNAAWRVTLYGIDGSFFGECLTFRRQGTATVGMLPIAATANVSFSLVSNALMATQTTGSSTSTKAVLQRLG